MARVSAAMLADCGNATAPSRLPRALLRARFAHVDSPHEHESLADLYVATIVRVEVDGRWMGARDAAAALGAFHVITAWNPGEARPSRTENDAANVQLHAMLVAKGCAPRRAVGGDPNSNHEEESWAVTGLDDHEARRIGAHFGQWAVFRITPAEQAVLGCFADWVRSRPLI